MNSETGRLTGSLSNELGQGLLIAVASEPTDIGQPTNQAIGLAGSSPGDPRQAALNLG